MPFSTAIPPIPEGLPSHCFTQKKVSGECLKWCSMEDYDKYSQLKPVRFPLWLSSGENDPEFPEYDSSYTRLSRQIGTTQVLYTDDSGRRELQNILIFSTAGFDGETDDIWCLPEAYHASQSYTASGLCQLALNVKRDGWFTSMEEYDQAVKSQEIKINRVFLPAQYFGLRP